MQLVLTLMQLAVLLLAGAYLVCRLLSEKKTPGAPDEAQYRSLLLQKSVSLTRPLSERARPARLHEIVGQKSGVKALRAALFGKYPQHVILYGPPGVGKTCAARLVFEEARKSRLSPFRECAPFIEMDASALRYDERGIADPLIGSVHDPIYQGAGEKGERGVPQPKIGAVTRAHGGVLFLDEIGEMHPNHMNRLLKVMEDRRVHPESAYYDAQSPYNTPFIREAFENGLPADFRLIAATSKPPEALSKALRSRAVEIFFKPLSADSLTKIAENAAGRTGLCFSGDMLARVGGAAENGRDAIRYLMLSVGMAASEGRETPGDQDLARALRLKNPPRKTRKAANIAPHAEFRKSGRMRL